MRDHRESAHRRAGAGPLVLTALMLVLIGGGWWLWANGEGSSEQATATRKVPVAKNVAIGPVIRRVERLRGIRFRRPLKIKLASPSQALALIRSAGQRRDSRRDRLIAEEELKLLGLLAPSVNLERLIRTIEEGEIAGFYDSESKLLVVKRGATDSRALQELTLAHELTHALEDQHYGLPEVERFSDDRAAAAEALFEGTATALMIDYAERYLDFGEVADILDDVAGADVELPRFVERQLLFPYEQGEQFVSAFRERGNWRAINQVLRLRYPRSTEQILHPERYAIDERPAKVDVSDVGRRLRSGWRRVDSTSVGEFDLDSLFRLVGKTKRGDAAEGWDGGRFDLWRKVGVGADCKAPCMRADVGVLRVAWDTDRDTRQAEKAFQHVLERGLEGTRLSELARAQMWSSRGGAIAMARRGNDTTVVFAPTPALARNLLRPR